ncbi:sporulation YhaL family protein [Salirhabdus salicampi]|uniref:sporulation YhaL family protein n=1 Tax=Salirhabdus salicampi TaxID=476102 RepID=UPI0020C46641|nr:sporulation YhaL family protein [Salirhabdus salicampi]
MILGVHWVIYVLIAFILFSGYMALRAMRAEKQLEQQFIEKEGQVYMERIERERKKRTNKDETSKEPELSGQ